MSKTVIPREKYIKQIKPFIDKDIIKVIVGQRRVGKSYFLLQIIDEIKKKNKKAHIIYINKELYEFDKIRNYRSLLDYIKKESNFKYKKNYLFIDEIQDIEQFEKALRSLKASGKYDIYCTGSNANLLSSELATLLSGRYVEIPIYSLSYTEFLLFHKLKDSDQTFLLYVKYGGLPYLIHLDVLEDDVVYPYLKSVYSTIFLKDIVARYNIRNVSFLEKLTNYIADNVSSILSAKKISDFLKAQKIVLSVNIVLDYLMYLENTFLIHKVSRFDIIGKKIFEVNDKFYFEDLGLRHSIKRYTQDDVAKVLENIVFLQLKYLGYKINIGKIQDKEIDFIAKKGNKTVYIQVAYIINEENKKREFGNLLIIKDNYEKMVISASPVLNIDDDYKGIKHFSIRNFLLKEEL